MEKILEVTNLTKLYRNGRGIKNITFDIFKGDVFGFLGPNGAGKTTVMKIITGLSRADKGEVKIFGYDITEQFEKAMAKVGCLIETADAYEYMSAYRNLELAARFYSDIKKTRIEEVLEDVGLGPFKHEKVGTFSLGMKQRLGLALAILSEPEFVILDEPVNGLDIEGMVDVRNTITHLAGEKQITFFISSHLIHEIELICNRIGIIINGQLIREGRVSELLSDQYNSLEDYYISQLRGEGGSFLR
ncbi:ABC transporter [Thermincola ferriacetica]|uniref:ABC transporter related protein n=2 Tax=Thermincola TaxID=278993 RepID=D5XC20_THEPJ|nr:MULTISPECIES: ABC transporter ATP-binding protein [Thermincola]ADG83472.1 ABC transporter related protein [Thermincola potens JR]KNZ69937.1 ABC transporter [Thermincola ferriacetica]